jgi:hypothetical protein
MRAIREGFAAAVPANDAPVLQRLLAEVFPGKEFASVVDQVRS